LGWLALIADPAWLGVTAVIAAITSCRIAVIAVFAGFDFPIPARNVDTGVATVASETAFATATRAALFGARAAIRAALARAGLAHAGLTRAACAHRLDTCSVNALEPRPAD
jgi:hypothetical protein